MRHINRTSASQIKVEVVAAVRGAKLITDGTRGGWIIGSCVTETGYLTRAAATTLWPLLTMTDEQVRAEAAQT